MLWFFVIIVSILVVTLLYLFPLIQICGDSMYPTLNDGDIVIGCRVFNIQVNGIYIFSPPVGEKYVVKRLKQVSSANSYKLFFEGDNSKYSHDSRMYGYVKREKVVARYLFTIYRRKECKHNECK